MNKFRSAILSGKGLRGDDPVVHGKHSRGDTAEDLAALEVKRQEHRSHNNRDEDRHRLSSETTTVRHDGATHAVELINLSGGGAMIADTFGPRLWDRVDLILAEDAELECAVRWLRGGRIGLEFAHETQIHGDPAVRDALLLEVVRRSFPDLEVPEQVLSGPQGDDDDSITNSRRADRRHPLIWMGDIMFNHGTERVRLRNISSTGALVECPFTYPTGAELLLDLGEAGQHFATVGWTCGDKAGLRFAAPFDLKALGKARPEVTGGGIAIVGRPRVVTENNSPWASQWQRQSVDELRDSLEGYLKR